jgi:hypothetical protein
MDPGADWPYNEVGKIPRGPLDFFFFLGQQFRFCSNFFFFWIPLKKNPTKIWVGFFRGPWMDDDLIVYII